MNVHVTKPREVDDVKYLRDIIKYLEDVSNCCGTFLREAPDTYDDGGIEITMDIDNVVSETCSKLLKMYNIQPHFRDTYEAILLLKYYIHDITLEEVIKEIADYHTDVDLEHITPFDDGCRIVLTTSSDKRMQDIWNVNIIEKRLKDYASQRKIHVQKENDYVIMEFNINTNLQRINKKQLIIDKIWELGDCEDINISRKFVDCISKIWIDCGYEDFKFIVEDFDAGYPYIIYRDATEIYTQTWGAFCERMIDEVKEYYDEVKEYERILEIELL